MAEWFKAAVLKTVIWVTLYQGFESLSLLQSTTKINILNFLFISYYIMSFYSFKNDYSEGAHEEILRTIAKTNTFQEAGYGNDNFSKNAAEIIQKKIENKTAAVHFVCGGTQANLVVVSSLLKPYESIIAAETGHIATSETGAIESTGHKVNTVATQDGKLQVADIKNVLEQHSSEHMVKPKAVFISNSTELGTIYSLKELSQLSHFCKQHNLYLYLDGARLGSALTSWTNDITLADIAKLVDVFYIGGTKNGALLGEAIVIINDIIKENFRFYMKQRGALLAKGRLLGIQFIELFKETLFFDLATHANTMARNLSEGIKKEGYKFLTEPASNQIFPILPNILIEKLKQKYDFYLWCKINERDSAIRLVTSWATKEEAVKSFLEDILR
jgi:threonine aldolase